MGKEQPDKLQELQQKCEEYLAGWKQALADYDNLKKDLVKEKGHIKNTVREDLAHQLLPVIDNYEQASRYVPDLQLEGEKQKQFEAFAQGIGHVENQLKQVLMSLGLQEISTEGRFDPEVHECVKEETDSEKEDQVITQVIQSGWRLNDKVIRPAKVIINKTQN